MKGKILIVEDDPHIRLGLEEILKSEGYEVNVCHRGDKAVDAVMKYQPSLIVLDVMLPGLSGYDVSKQLRARKLTEPGDNLIVLSDMLAGGLKVDCVQLRPAK